MTIGAFSQDGYANYGGYGNYGNYGSYGSYGDYADGRDGYADYGDDSAKKAGKSSSPEECQTCRNRKYQDGSDEANVSFKAASHVSPGAAGAAVRAHEGQHVSNAYKKAAQDDGEVVNASVSIHTAVCPECGRTYVSGGVTNTTIKYGDESNPYTQNQKAVDALRYTGANVDYAA